MRKFLLTIVLVMMSAISALAAEKEITVESLCGKRDQTIPKESWKKIEVSETEILYVYHQALVTVLGKDTTLFERCEPGKSGSTGSIYALLVIINQNGLRTTNITVETVIRQNNGTWKSNFDSKPVSLSEVTEPYRNALKKLPEEVQGRLLGPQPLEGIFATNPQSENITKTGQISLERLCFYGYKHPEDSWIHIDNNTYVYGHAIVRYDPISNQTTFSRCNPQFGSDGKHVVAGVIYSLTRQTDAAGKLSWTATKENVWYDNDIWILSGKTTKSDHNQVLQGYQKSLKKLPSHIEKLLKIY